MLKAIASPVRCCCPSPLAHAAPASSPSPSQTFCNGGQQAAFARAAADLSLQQCGNVAFGECQKYGKDSSTSPCGSSFYGVAQCNEDAFKKFYNAEVDERCGREADRIGREGP